MNFLRRLFGRPAAPPSLPGRQSLVLILPDELIGELMEVANTKKVTYEELLTRMTRLLLMVTLGQVTVYVQTEDGYEPLELF